jgi:hypothetical protein
VNPEWLGAVGTTVAAGFGVAAFGWQVAGSRERRKQTREAQARKVWFEMKQSTSVFSTDNPEVHELSALPVTVHNGSDEVIAWVQVELVPIYQGADGKITRIPPEHTEESETWQGVTAIGPNGYWITHPVTIEVPNLGLDGVWLWECTIVFEDSAGLRWQRVGEAQRLDQRRKEGAEREAEKHLLR